MRARARFRIMVEVDSNMAREDINRHALTMARDYQSVGGISWQIVLVATEQLLPSEKIIFDQRKS